MAGLFLSSPPPTSPRTPPPPLQPSPSQRFLFLICFFFSFFLSCLSPFEFQRKPTTLKYQTGKEKGWWGGFGDCEVFLLSSSLPPPPYRPLSIFSVAPSAPALGCDVFFIFFIFTHLLRFSGGKVGLNPDFFEAREMILLWRIGPLKTSLNSSWCCKVTENLLRAGAPQCDASGLGTN